MSYCFRSSCIPPEVWCSKTAEDLKQFDVDYKLLSPDIFSAVSGPDVGVEFISNLEQNGCQNNGDRAQNGSLVEGSIRFTMIVKLGIPREHLHIYTLEQPVWVLAMSLFFTN